MTIEFVKFGNLLTSRQDGKEALAAINPTLNKVTDQDEIIVDFKGVVTFSPSWGDEFLTPLQNRYGNRLQLIHTQNSSVQATIKLLEKVNEYKFNVQNGRNEV